MNTFAADSQYIAGTYKRFPVELVSGEGATFQDANGKTYIDMGSGIAVNAFGVNDKEWKEAVIAQLNSLQHTSNLYYTQPQVRLAQLMCEKSGMKRVFFGNSGAEANECLIKVARKYASDKYGEGARPTIVTLINSFHGRTISTLSATGQDVFHTNFGPFTPGFVHVPANDIAAMEQAFTENSVCAVLVEIVQGEGGVLPLEEEYVKKVQAMCKEKDILFAVDEVQTGNGRCGAFYAYQLYGLEPDVVSTAKGMAGGLPMGACLLGEKVKDTLSAGSHGSTFGGNPVCAAGAYSILSRIDDVLLREVNRKHDKIVAALTGAKGVKSITGLGLMLGIETEMPAGEAVAACMEKGVLPLTAKNKVRLLPPLNITDAELDQALCIMKEVFAK